MRRNVYAIAILVGILFAQNKENQSPAESTKPGAMEHKAPIGHRQPTTKTLPADVLQREQNQPVEKKPGKNLTICKGC
jgi:hypothetical protein